MANPKKQVEIVRNAMNNLDIISRGDNSRGLEDSLSKLYSLFLNVQTIDNFLGDFHNASDYAQRNCRVLFDYCRLYSGRKIVDISGGEREIATEEDAYKSLVYAESLINELIIPNFRETSPFTNSIFKDFTNLCYTYLDAVVNGVAEEYIPLEDTLDAKNNAVELAKQGARVCKSYSTKGLSDTTIAEFAKVKSLLDDTSSSYMRSFSVVATNRKRIAHGKELTDELAEKVTMQYKNGRFEFEPLVIFPIAHGGSELAIKIANVYHDKGCDPLVYPLMFSIKTKRQKYPWVKNDSKFLGRDLRRGNLLITEDWVTTGNTLRGILNQLENTYPREIRVATIKRDPLQSKIPILERYCFYTGAETKYIGGKNNTFSQ